MGVIGRSFGVPPLILEASLQMLGWNHRKSKKVFALATRISIWTKPAFFKKENSISPRELQWHRGRLALAMAGALRAEPEILEQLGKGTIHVSVFHRESWRSIQGIDMIVVKSFEVETESGKRVTLQLFPFDFQIPVKK